MKITDLFASSEKTFSFEFFPPKDEISAVDFGINVGQLLKLEPSFVTVTYGAGGSNQERTFALVEYLQNRIGLVTMAHYTCVGSDREKISTDMKQLSDMGIENLMLLRGDPPRNSNTFRAPENGFAHASDLIGFVRQQHDFAIGAAAYPEAHPESPGLEEDVSYLKLKCEMGADFLITQLFFDNESYFRLLRLAKEAGIRCRIIPGIIPITSYRQVKRFVDMTSARIPEELMEALAAHQDDPVRNYQTGLDFAIRQCRELLEKGAPGLHFYTLNKSRAAVELFESLSLQGHNNIGQG